jgi:hypothetical protein
VHLPSLLPLLIAASLLMLGSPAVATDRAYPLMGRDLPAALAPADRHVPSPWPPDEDPSYQGGPSVLSVTGVLMTSAAVVLGVVAASQAVRLKNETDPSRRASIRKVRNGTGYAAIGLAAGGGVCLVLNRAL